MAKILLNVELESKTFQAQLQKIKEQLDQTFSATGGVGGGVGGGIKAAKAQVESLQKSFANLLNTLKGSEGKYAPDTFKKLKTEITNALNETKALNKEIGDGKPTDEQKKRYAQLNKQLSTLSSTFATTRVEAQKLQKENKLSIPNVDNLRKKYANLLNTIQGTEKYYRKGTFSSISEQAKQYLSDLNALIPTQENYAEEVNRLDKELNRLSADFAETRQSAKNFHGSLGEIVKGFIKFQAAAMIVMKPLQMVRTAWEDLNETLVETEDAVIALRRVAGDAANANELYDLAQRYGQTFENVNELATNFARAGYDWNETIKATEAALLALNTAELDAIQASEGMIAILQQFGYEASELESIIDKLNITADNAAVSTDALLKALTRTGSSAKNANLTLEETVGIITALSEATGRSGENLGTAINSLIQFSTKASSLDTFAKLGGDVERVVTAYKQGGATVLDIWEELSKVIQKNQSASAESILGEGFTTEEFEALNEELKQALGENFAQTTEIYDTASTFRKNYFIALLQNLDQVQESLDTMQDSQGYSQKENALYLESYTGRVNELKAKWQEIANDEQGLLGIKKDLVDMAFRALELLDKLGGLETVIKSIALAFAPFAAKWTLVFGAKALTSALVGVKALFSAMRTGAMSVNAALGAIGAVFSIASLIEGAISSKQEEDAEKARETKAEEEAKGMARINSIANSMNESLSEAQALQRTIEEISKLKEETAESSETTNRLIKIEEDLVKTNSGLKDSIDLVNGSTEDAIKAIEEEGKAKLENWKKTNASDITFSREFLSQYVNQTAKVGSETTATELNKIADALGLERIIYDMVYTDYERQGEGIPIIGGLIGDFQDWLSSIDSETFGEAGEYTYSIGYSGSRSNAVNDLKSFYEAVKKQYQGDDKTEVLASISGLIDSINSDTYKNAQSVVDYADKVEKVLSGSMSYADFAGINISPEEQASAQLKDVVSKLEAIRENTEKTKELEEKQLALEEAKNQRTVRVFNAETGQWEMRANEKDIAKAEKDLQDTAMDNIIDYLSTDDAKSKLAAGEFTIPDWLAEMISKPTTDEAFQAFMTSMGIMSGAVNKTPTGNGAITNNTTSSTTNNNQSYSLNGIPIPAEDASRYFTPEALELLNQMGD